MVHCGSDMVCCGGDVVRCGSDVVCCGSGAQCDLRGHHSSSPPPPQVSSWFISHTIFVANPFSFSQCVFFQREAAASINREARIFDFVVRPDVTKKYFLCMPTPFIFVHCVAHALRRRINLIYCESQIT